MEGEHQTQIISIIGAGGLGVPCAWGLVSNWPTNIPLVLRIFDPDSVDLSNLNRQVLFTQDDIDQNKAKALTARLEQIKPTNCDITILPSAEKVTPQNISKELKVSSYIVDATDSTETKFLLNDYAVAHDIPYCYGGVLETAGQILNVINKKNSPAGCLRCLFEEFGEDSQSEQTTTCRQQGVLAPVVGQVGFLQAKSVIDYLVNNKVSNGLTRIKFDSPESKTSLVPALESCPNGCGITDKQSLDLTDQKCPETFLYTKMAMERLDSKYLELKLASKESVLNVRKSIEEEGYQVFSQTAVIPDLLWKLTIGKRVH